MSNSSISGLELFQMPFSNHVSRQTQESRQQDTGRQQHPAAAQDKVPQQSGRQTAVQQPVTQKPAEQAAKPTAAAVYKPDIAPSKRNTNENKYAKPEAEEKQPDPELSQKEQHTENTIESPAHTEQKELVLDMSSGSAASGDGKSGNADDAAKRKAHEEAEAKRKAEWEAKQLEKKQKEAEAIQNLQDMSDDDVISVSTKRISTDVERITRRNMKECVAEHVQDLCRKDPAFARLTMHPRKSMAHCFRYINRKAKEFILQEMEENGIPKDRGGYGSDVPDGFCYQWSEDYFHDADAPEDREKEEKYVPKPYTGTVPKTKNAAYKPKKEEKQPESSEYEQMSFV